MRRWWIPLAYVGVVHASFAETSSSAKPDPATDRGLREPFANTDPDDDTVVAPPPSRDQCEAELTRAGIRFRRARIPVHVEGKRRKITCGADQLVTYLGSSSRIAYNAPPTVTCSMALALARFEAIVQEEAERQFHKRVKSITHVGTYNCREMAAYPGWVSEHSYANAIDIASFTLADNATVSVLGHFETSDAPTTSAKGAFLRKVSRRAFDEATFSSVLTAYFDRRHRDHFHLDLARYRVDGTRSCPEQGC